ncbi:hypothetical protein B0I35DRAFT_506339 [Stachybotrys elegans]|uniref:Uncharacterized protein n=1 Tax=Stachybotrys elegans TaxID=80388 RepID=A0A8K0T1P6_9HYPO|nr:hypothetical protein B0I35DRAFT_506339 [Stachybotrys elegans]
MAGIQGMTWEQFLAAREYSAWDGEDPRNCKSSVQKHTWLLQFLFYVKPDIRDIKVASMIGEAIRSACQHIHRTKLPPSTSLLYALRDIGLWELIFAQLDEDGAPVYPWVDDVLHADAWAQEEAAPEIFTQWVTKRGDKYDEIVQQERSRAKGKGKEVDPTQVPLPENDDRDELVEGFLPRDDVNWAQDAQDEADRKAAMEQAKQVEPSANELMWRRSNMPIVGQVDAATAECWLMCCVDHDLVDLLNMSPFKANFGFSVPHKRDNFVENGVVTTEMMGLLKELFGEAVDVHLTEPFGQEGKTFEVQCCFDKFFVDDSDQIWGQRARNNLQGIFFTFLVWALALLQGQTRTLDKTSMNGAVEVLNRILSSVSPAKELQNLVKTYQKEFQRHSAPAETSMMEME